MEWPGTDLEPLTKPLDESQTDNGTSQFQPSLVNVDPPLEADAEFRKSGEPGQGALDDPAMTTQTLRVLNSSSGNPRLNAVME